VSCSSSTRIFGLEKNPSGYIGDLSKYAAPPSPPQRPHIKSTSCPEMSAHPPTESVELSPSLERRRVEYTSEYGALQYLFGLSLTIKQIRKILNKPFIRKNITAIIRETDPPINYIPSEVFSLTALVTLVLHNQKILSVPPTLEQLQSLTFLDLSSNDLSALPSTLKHLSHLETLCVNNNSLKSLPDLPKGLLKLSISKNSLSTMPQSISSLPKLEELFMNGCLLSTLYDLPVSLTFLDLGNNPCLQIPEQIGRLSRLKTLIFSGNTAAMTLEHLSPLSNLEELYLCANYARKLPTSLWKLENIRRAFLSDNAFAAIPVGIIEFGWHRITFLDLSRNNLSSVPENLGKLTQLQELLLSRNELQSWPQSSNALISLTHLDLSQNRLTQVFPEILTIPNLQKITLQYNHILASSVCGIFKALTHLQACNLVGNPIEIGHIPKPLRKKVLIRPPLMGTTRAPSS